MLEPYEWKHSRTVLRRESGSNPADLVDKLRDMGKTVGFEVFWDSDAKCVQVKSGIPYTGEAPAKAEPDKPESHPEPTAPANDADVGAMKQDIVDRTNTLRKENGIAALTTSAVSYTHLTLPTICSV